MLKKWLPVLILISIFSSCRYKPFVKYYFPNKKTDLASFSKKEKFLGEKNRFRAYDIITYDWYINVLPDSKRIEGTMQMDFRPEVLQDTILLDLHRKLNVIKIEGNQKIDQWNHKGDALYISFSESIPPGSPVSIWIAYEGKPTIIMKEGPIQWKTDPHGNPWVSTQTEGIGAHYIMPCKEMLYDEPEQCFIRVAVPNDLTVVANGHLDSVTVAGDDRIFHHSVQNPINIYNISFNIGKYAKADLPYVDILGTRRTIELWALENQLEEAVRFYSQSSLLIETLEALYGPFPWWNDGCKIVQTTLGYSAMEHQSAISMGSHFYNDFTPKEDSLHINTTLAHELAHEWWGNLLTGYDYCDMWLHEGFATYSEALVVEHLYAKPEYYDQYIRWLSRWVKNERPLLKTCGVRYNSWVSPKDQDIYNKGALFIHTLRKQLANDRLFFATLKAALQAFDRRSISTATFEAFFSKQTGRDFSAIFEWYLNESKPPILGYSYDSVNHQLSFRWKQELPEDFSFRVVAQLDETQIAIQPTNRLQTIPAASKPVFDIATFGYVLLEDLE